MVPPCGLFFTVGCDVMVEKVIEFEGAAGAVVSGLVAGAKGVSDSAVQLS